MNLGERIEAAEKELVATKDALLEATKALEAAPDEEVLLIEVEELTAKVEKQTGTIEALKKAEKALAARVAEKGEQGNDPNAPAVLPNLQKHRVPDMKPGELLFKMGAAQITAYVQRRDINEVLRKEYPTMPVLTEINKHLVRRAKSQVDPAMTHVTGWAAELMQNDVRGFIDTLKDVSVAAALAGYSQQLTFGGYNSITIPRRVPPAGVLTEPAWVSESQPIPVAQYEFASTTIYRYKLAAITSMTKECAERATPDLEGILREALRDSYSAVLDNALLSDIAAVPLRNPAGLLNGVSLTAGTAGGGEDAVRADILALLTSMTAAKLGAKPVLIMNNLDRMAASMMTSALSEYMFRDELSSGNLMGVPVVSSARVPQHTLVLVDAAYLATAFDMPTFDVSDVATWVEASANDTAPTMASDDTGALGTPGYVGPGEGIPVGQAGRPLGVADAGYRVRSAWQTHTVGIKMIAPTSWALMQPGAVAGSDDTTWTA